MSNTADEKSKAEHLLRVAGEDALGAIERTVEVYESHTTPYAKERVRLAKVALAAVRRAVKEKR